MDPLKLIVSILASFSAGLIGGLVTAPNLPVWYAGLIKPPLNPPNFVFGPVWSVLYLLMGISLYLIWTSPQKNKTIAYLSFIVQLVLNVMWSAVFFGLHLPVVAAAVIVLLIAAIVINMVQFYQISKPAAYLLVPYLLWTCFATYLTIGIVAVN